MRFSTCFRLIAAVFILILTSILSLAQSAPAAGFSRQINGQVRYADSRLPAENVVVRLESTSGGLTDQVMTDRTGKFSFTGLRGEQFRVTAHAPGYVDAQETIELLTVPTGYVNFQLVRDHSSVADANVTGIITVGVPMEAQTEYKRAKELLDSNKKEKTTGAVAHLEKAISIHPEFYEAHLALGLAEMDLGQWDKAEKELLATIALKKEGSTAYVALGDAYRRQKKYSESERTLLEGLKENPDSAEGHALLAAVYWETAPSTSDQRAFRNRLQTSWIEVEKALKLKPSLSDAQLLAGNLLLKARRGADALKHFEEYLRLEPKGASADQVRSVVQKLKQALAQDEKKQT